MNHSKLPALIDLGILLALWLAAVCLLLRALAADGQSLVTFNLAQFTGATNDTTITLRARNNPVIYAGQFYWQPADGLALATTNGQAATLLIPGQYTVALAGVPQSWTITVTNSAAPLNAASLTTDTIIYNGINRLSGPGVTNDGAGDYFVPVLTNQLSALVLTNAVALASAGLYVSNQVVYVSTNSDVYGAAFAATNALAGSGAFLAAAALVTNGQAAVTLGTLTANGAGLTNLPAYAALAGQLQLQPGWSMTVVTSYLTPQSVFVGWHGFQESSNQYTPGYYLTPLTNQPQLALYCGYPVAQTILGDYGAVNGFTAANVFGGYPQYTELRFVTSIYGNTLGFDTQDGNVWVSVDGSAWVNYVMAGVGNHLFWTLTLPNYGLHHVQLQFMNTGVDGLYVPPTNSFVNVAHPSLTGIVVGDSISDGAGGPLGEAMWPAQLENLLLPYGINLVSQSEGGTGYQANGTTPGSTNFLYRITNCIAAFNPGFVIWAGGINDESNTNGLFSTMTNCFGLLHTLLPGCKQMVIAPWGTMSQGGSTNLTPIFQAAAAAYNLPIIYPEYTWLTAWVTGIYNVPGSGSAPFYWSGDGPHPNAAGQQFYADQLASFVLTNLIPNASPIIW